MTEQQTTNNCINLGSYNYLGFAESSGPCNDQAVEACKKYGLSASSTRHEVWDQLHSLKLKGSSVPIGPPRG